MDKRTTYYRGAPQVSIARALGIGLAAGFVGATVMTLTNKLEQLFTFRPNSYVPAHTFGYHLAYSSSQYTHSDTLNWMHHYGVGMLTGPVRALTSYYGIIGPVASFFFTGIRLEVDQVMENKADLVIYHGSGRAISRSLI